MEEIQKKTRKASSAKESTEAPKKSTPKKATKTTKASTTKKEAKKPKVTTSEKEVKEPKTSSAKKETKKTKLDTEKKENKGSKSDTDKKETKTSKFSATKKENSLTEANVEKKDSVKKELKEKNTKKVSVDSKTSKPNKVETNQVGKRYIYISVGSIIAIIIIFVLIMLNAKLAVHAYNVTKEKFTSQTEIEDIDLNSNDEQEVGTVLNNKNETVNKILEKITLAPNATASIYKTENFSEDTIPNDLKLRIGWAKVQDEKKLRAKEENDETIVAVESKTMKESIQNIFGTDTKIKDESFENTDVSTFAICSENKGIVKYNNELYTATLSELNSKDTPLIYQEVQKVVQYDNRIMVYVKTAFIDVKDEKYIIYKNHNGEFNNKLLEATQQELFMENSVNQYTGEGTVKIKENSSSVISSIRNELNTYIYTFTIDNQTNEYYLSGFNGRTN